MPVNCNQLWSEYKALTALKAEFDLEYAKAIETGDLTRIRELKTELEQGMTEIKEKIREKKLRDFEDKSLIYIEGLLKEGANKCYVAEGLSGLDSDKAWEMREQLLKEGANKDYVAMGLSGNRITFVWRLKKELPF